MAWKLRRQDLRKNFAQTPTAKTRTPTGVNPIHISWLHLPCGEKRTGGKKDKPEPKTDGLVPEEAHEDTAECQLLHALLRPVAKKASLCPPHARHKPAVEPPVHADACRPRAQFSSRRPQDKTCPHCCLLWWLRMTLSENQWTMKTEKPALHMALRVFLNLAENSFGAGSVEPRE